MRLPRVHIYAYRPQPVCLLRATAAPTCLGLARALPAHGALASAAACSWGTRCAGPSALHVYMGTHARIWARMLARLASMRASTALRLVVYCIVHAASRMWPPPISTASCGNRRLACLLLPLLLLLARLLLLLLASQSPMPTPVGSRWMAGQQVTFDHCITCALAATTPPAVGWSR